MMIDCVQTRNAGLQSNAVVGSSTTQVVTSGESAKYASGDSYDDDSMVDEVHAPEEKKAQ